jgi:hypothetical protein
MSTLYLAGALTGEFVVCVKNIFQREESDNKNGAK